MGSQLAADLAADLEWVGLSMEHRENDMAGMSAGRLDDYRCSLQLPPGIDQAAEDTLPVCLRVGQADAERMVKIAEVIPAGTMRVFQGFFDVFGDGKVRHTISVLGSEVQFQLAASSFAFSSALSLISAPPPNHVRSRR